MKTVLRSLLGCALFLLSAPAFAGDTSVIVGTVVSAETKKPVEDLVVTATSPSLQGEQVVVTDEQGQYRIPQLPAGVYTLRFEKEGFKPYERADITLRAQRTVRVKVEMATSPFEEELVLVRPPLNYGFECATPGSGLQVDPEFIRRIAPSRPMRQMPPAWMLPHMIVLVPDGKPQTVYREPSSDGPHCAWEE